MSVFLAELSQSYRDNHLAVVMDGAGCNKCKDLVIPDNNAGFLSPYSLEFNPVEQLWKTMRGKWFANKLFESMDTLENNLVEALRWVKSVPDLIRSFVLYSWIQSDLSA